MWVNDNYSDMNDMFFSLLQSAIGTQKEWTLRPEAKEWEELFRLSKQQGVTAVVFEFISTLPEGAAPKRELVMKWLSATMYIERTMRSIAIVADYFASKMAERNIPVVVLKGMAFAKYYNNPLHREFGDLDCYLMGKKDEGDSAIAEIGGKMECAGYKHSHLLFNGIVIENHRYFTDFENTKTGIATEKALASLILSGCVPICNRKLLCPSATFNALFLLKHAQGHFIDEGIRIRYVLDWALFLNKEQENVDWELILQMLKETGTERFAGVMTAIVIRYLRIEVKNAGLLHLAKHSDVRMVDMVLTDIMGEQPEIYNRGLLHKVLRIARRFRRMWVFRSLASESYMRMVWNSFAFSSYMKRDIKMDL